jgi:hypothetical protein
MPTSPLDCKPKHDFIKPDACRVSALVAAHRLPGKMQEYHAVADDTSGQIATPEQTEA